MSYSFPAFIDLQSSELITKEPPKMSYEIPFGGKLDHFNPLQALFFFMLKLSYLWSVGAPPS